MQETSGMRFGLQKFVFSVTLTLFTLVAVSTASIAAQSSVSAAALSTPLRGGGYEDAPILFAPAGIATSTDVSFSQLLSELDHGNVRDVVIQGPEIHGTFTNGSSFHTYAPSDPTLVKRPCSTRRLISESIFWTVASEAFWVRDTGGEIIQSLEEKPPVRGHTGAANARKIREHVACEYGIRGEEPVAALRRTANERAQPLFYFDLGGVRFDSGCAPDLLVHVSHHSSGIGPHQPGK